jgi:hypothetical protein
MLYVSYFTRRLSRLGVRLWKRSGSGEIRRVVWESWWRDWLSCRWTVELKKGSFWMKCLERRPKSR